MDNPFDLTGKVVVITGGGGFLGSAIARALAVQGAIVIIAEVNEALGLKVATSLREIGLSVEYGKLDISDELSVTQLIADVVSRYQKIDVWINNAYPRTSDWGKLFEDIPFASWKINLDAHLGGYFLCCQKIAGLMEKQGYGNIINFASIYGVVGPDFSIYEGTSMTMPAAYAAIKGAIVNFSRYLASYYGKAGVRVNTISPGGIFDHQPRVFVQNYIKKCPLQRMGQVEDIVGPIVFLTSDASSYITGHNLVVDGGWTAV